MKARKLMSVLVGSLIWVSAVAPTYGQILHTQRTDETITKGVQLISEAILTDAGWQDINMLKVNLGSGVVELRPMESINLGERKTVLQMANENGAIAGINADFLIPRHLMHLVLGQLLQKKDYHIAIIISTLP